jgi:hypothetical protein
MIESLFKRASLLADMRSGPGGPYLEAFAETLQKARYKAGTICSYLRGADSLARWAEEKGIAVGDLSEVAAESYVASLRGASRGQSKGPLPSAAVGARRFFRVLCQQGIVAQAPVVPERLPADGWLNLFSQHLSRVAGVSEDGDPLDQMGEIELADGCHVDLPVVIEDIHEVGSHLAR